MFIGFMKFPVDCKDFFLPGIQWLVTPESGFKPHGPFQFRVAGTDLGFIGPVIGPETVRGRDLDDLF